jgi:hypothetical protein
LPIRLALIGKTSLAFCGAVASPESLLLVEADSIDREWSSAGHSLQRE